MDNIFLKIKFEAYAQVLRFRLTEVEADDYGTGKFHTGIYQRIGGIRQPRVDDEYTFQFIYYLCTLGMIKCSRLIKQFNLTQ